MTTKVFDTFTGADGTDISAHTPDTDVVGGGWSQVNTDRVELDGAGGLKFSASLDYCGINVGATDQWVTVNWYNGGVDNRMGVYLRSDLVGINRDAYMFQFRSGNTGGELTINRVDAGGSTEIATASFAADLSATYLMEMSIEGSSLVWKIDGVIVLTATDATHTTGSGTELTHFLRTNANARFYDFQVNDAAPVAPTLDDINTTEIVLDAETGVTFTTSGFSGEITTVKLVSGTSETDGTSVSSTGGAGTFNLPNVSAYAVDTVGSPFTSASHTVVARLTDA